MKKSSLELFFILPIKNFIEKKTSVGLSLIIASLLALIVANSPWKEYYHAFLKQELYVGFNDFLLKKDLLHWINDGMMSMFFFLIGLELKKELLQGELSGFKQALLPAVAAFGGMLVPALIYLFFTAGTEASSGWGIPMATDIAFALGILYLLGDRVPISLKIFLTAIAIVDDLGAVLVIAFFYTGNISINNLILGIIFLLVLISGNRLGIRNTLFYALIGIGGVWLAVLLSGVHATIAAVMVAFTIPMNKRVPTGLFLRKARMFIAKIKKEYHSKLFNKKEREERTTHTMEKISMLARESAPPLQRLEYNLHAFVSFVVLPLFAFANAGVTFDMESLGFLTAPVTLGVIFGLLAGKTIGILLFTRLVVMAKWCPLPHGLTWRHVAGAAFLSAIGFTMSLFISDLAFDKEEYLIQSKLGILVVSLIAGITGYFSLKVMGIRNKK